MIQSRSFPVLLTYGMTETASQIATQSPGEMCSSANSVGRPLCYAGIKIVGPDGGAVPPDHEGRIAVRGETLFDGYIGVDNTATFDSDRWFLTGDTGAIDTQGCLYIIGRIDDMFISGGENIHPSTIEKVALRFTGVAEACVVPVEDARWGARPVLFVVGTTKSGINIRELRAYLEIDLSIVLLPDTIIELESLPRLSLEKIDKEALKQLYMRTVGNQDS
jgi:O-succinylbenzoic acid--CoA ligase